MTASRGCDRDGDLSGGPTPVATQPNYALFPRGAPIWRQSNSAASRGTLDAPLPGRLAPRTSTSSLHGRWAKPGATLRIASQRSFPVAGWLRSQRRRHGRWRTSICDGPADADLGSHGAAVVVVIGGAIVEGKFEIALVA